MSSSKGVPASPSGFRPTDGAASVSAADAASIPNAEPYGEPVRTLEELDALEDAEVIEGYYDGRRNDPPPTGNRSRSYWHGWRNGMADAGHMEIDGAMRALAHNVVTKRREGTR